MATTRASRANHSTSRRGLVYILAVTLCVLAPFVVFLTANNYPLFVTEVLLLYLAGLVVGLVIGALVKLRLLALGLFALWGCVFVAIAFMSDLDSVWWVAAVALASGIVIWMLRDNVATIVSVAAAVHISSTLVLNYVNRPNVAEPSVHSIEPAVSAAPDLPPVLHLIMDEFAGLRGLPGEFAGGQELVSKLADYYPALGFELYSHVYSQYFNSGNSLANLVNFASSATDGAFVSRDGQAFMASNSYFDHLLDLGYALHIYQSSYLDFCVTPDVPVTSCSTYKSNSIAAIASVDMQTSQKSRFILNSYLDSSAFLRNLRRAYHRAGKRLSIALPAWPANNSHTGPLAVMRTIAELEAALRKLRPGEVHFAHLLLPHYPYNLDANCTLRPLVSTWLNRTPFEVVENIDEQNNSVSRQERYLQYLAQTTCAQAMLEELIAAIRASGQWHRSIIIIHGDHGSRIVRREPLARNLAVLVEDDFRDAYAAFFAVKNGRSIGRLNTSVLPLQAALARAWQLPTQSVEPQQVYMRVLGQIDMLATPLWGFDPVPGMSSHRQQSEH